MLAHLIQRQVPIGSQVTFSLKNGLEISGILTEIGRDHVTIERHGNSTTILVEMVGLWEVKEEAPLVSRQQTLDAEFPDDKNILTTLPVNQSTAVKGESTVTSDGVVAEPSIQTAVEDEATVSSHSVKPEVFRKLLEIEVRFHTHSQAAKIELKPADFSFVNEEFYEPHKAEAIAIWERLKSRYENAAKINELSTKFGLIQPLIQELKSLAKWFPTSPNVKRHLAYMYALSGHRQEALQCYNEAAVASRASNDWYNMAVLALETASEEKAYYGLDQFFSHARLTDEPDAWYIYINLLKNFSHSSTFFANIDTKERMFSQQEENMILEACIYLLKSYDRSQIATNLVQRWLQGNESNSLTLEALRQLNIQPTKVYQQIVPELTVLHGADDQSQLQVAPHQAQGYVLKYFPDRNYGFLRGVDGTDYFFHRSAVADEELFSKIATLSSGIQIPVTFETAQGQKGTLAVGVALYRTIDEMFELAVRHANDGEYSKAIPQIRKVLALNPEYPQAQEFYAKWHEHARVTGVPQGSNPYARARRVQLIEKDLERAVYLFQTAIQQGDNVESAIKDLAALLVQLGRPREAVDFLIKNRNKIIDQQSVDNMLILFCQNAGQYDQSIELLQKRFKQTTIVTKKIQILWQIANCYLRKDDFVQAEKIFMDVLKIQSDNNAARRNVAYCLFKRGQFDEAEKMLNDILDVAPNARVAELLDVIRQAKVTGNTGQIIFETSLSVFSTDITEFAQFFLKRCDFQGVPPDRVQKQDFNRSDIQKLEELATRLGTRRPRDRSGYYLSAAKIVADLGEEDPKRFYRYLGRSLASMGDAAVVENRPLDTAQDLYCEALAVYDGDRNSGEQDAVNALVRYIFATLGQSYIPIKPKIPTIDETVEKVLNHHPQRDRVFEAIAYLVSRSRYAAERILDPLYSKSTLQAIALEFLKNKGISTAEPIRKLDSFVSLWNELRRKNFDDLRTISGEFRFLRRVELTTASLENTIERVKGLGQRLFFDLDQQRTRQLQQIFETVLELCKQITFEEQERLCIQIESRCQDLLKEVEDNPTKLSVEELYPVIEIVKQKASERLEELYRSSAPQLTLRLPMESYTPDNNQQLEVQVVADNRIGCSPAESLELIFQEDHFELIKPEIKLDGSLRGGDQQILRVPIRVSEQAIRSQTFSLPVYAQYRTRSGETPQTLVYNFSIRLYSETEFKEIENPYAYAEGGIVDSPEMFYGRKELIENVARVIQESRTQSKSIVIFGQKRAGKSSILYHLKSKLQANRHLLILDIGNIGSILDEHSKIPFLYQILWSILNKLEYAIEDKTLEGFKSLSLSFPSAKEFYTHPSPLVSFKEVFESYKRSAARLEEWRSVQAVLLIDEFSYIYAQIVNGRVPTLFMTNWKALLQENYFNAVLVGQDVMPKFKQRFPNEFGTIQDERVSYLREEDARKLIDEPIRIDGRQGESRYRERAIERIVDLTAGSPFYIQIICNRLVDYMNRKRAKLATASDVEQVKDELIRDVNALGLDKFDNLINSGDTSEDAISDEDTLKVLTAIAVNSRTGPCNRSSIACATRAPVDTILEDLVQREVIERERAQYYRIRVGLFKEWLIAHA
jgi:tetratricopeptide (TPR) repeat protein